MDIQLIQNKIYEIRGQKVMLDFDLAEMYDAETRVLNQVVERNIERFPEDFIFQLTTPEWKDISSQFVMTSRSKRPKSVVPFAFTQEGVAVLSGVLWSPIAIQVNINIMRAFVAVRNVFAAAKESNLLSTLMDHIKALEDVSEETLAAINDLSEDNRKEFDDIYIALAELLYKCRAS